MHQSLCQCLFVVRGKWEELRSVSGHWYERKTEILLSVWLLIYEIVVLQTALTQTHTNTVKVTFPKLDHHHATLRCTAVGSKMPNGNCTVFCGPSQGKMDVAQARDNQKVMVL